MLNNQEVGAVVGVAINNEVFYNFVEHSGEFEFTGLNIIDLLNESRNEYIADMFLSQSYGKINGIYYDGVELIDYVGSNGSNVASYEDMYSTMENDLGPFDYYYIYDFTNDVFVIKTPYTKPMALDYKNEEDVSYFLEYLNASY